MEREAVSANISEYRPMESPAPPTAPEPLKDKSVTMSVPL